MKRKTNFIHLLILLLFIFSCKNQNELIAQAKTEIIQSKGKDLKNILIKYNVTSPEQIVFDDPDYYYIFAKLYDNNIANDNFTNYLIEKAVNSDNIFKEDALDFQIKLYIKNNNILSLKYLIKNNESILNKNYKDFLISFNNSQNIDDIADFPSIKDFFPLVHNIVNKNFISFNKPENQKKVIKYLIKTFSKEKEISPEYLNYINDFIVLSKNNPFFEIFYSIYAKTNLISKDTISKAINISDTNEEFNFIKKYCSNIKEKRYFYDCISKIADKNKYTLYYYATEKTYFYGTKKAQSDLEYFLKKYPERDEFFYNIKSKILYNNYAFETKWIAEVVDFSNDFPNSYNGKSLLNWAFRSAIYQNKQSLLLPFIDKINFNQMDTTDKSTFYYLLYDIDKKNKDKWKNILKTECPFSYANLTLNKPEFFSDKEQQVQNVKEEESVDLKRNIKKVTYLLDFGLTDEAIEIKNNIAAKNEKAGILDIFYNFYIKKEDYYDAMKYQFQIAEIKYGDNLSGIDSEDLKKLFPSFYKEYILKYAETYNIDPALAFAVMREESLFNKDIVSHANAIGLMQIMPSTGRFIAQKNNIESYDLTNPEDNIHMGIYYLKYLSEKNKDYPLILASYNAGPGRIKQWKNMYKKFPKNIMYELIPIEESRGYIKKVMRSYYIYKYFLTEDENNEKQLATKLNSK
jgi:soluble lytic murein transglycosylase